MIDLDSSELTTTDKTITDDSDSNSPDSETSQLTEKMLIDESLIGTIEETRFGKIKHISIVDEMEKSYLDYAMSVIVARALPDVRDGLKPVHRRILYSMYKSGIHHSSGYKKSARIVGDVLGKYHPHGDAPVYMALVRLAQEFSMRYPLIDGQGNFGSIDGDSPAAMRYTEARLAKISGELLSDIQKNTVGMIDNFDGSLKEPIVLPTKLPNLLLMGSEGIAVGMATKIPPHNLTEVNAAVIAMIKAGKATATLSPSLLEENSATATSKNPAFKDQVVAPAVIDRLLATPAEQLAGQFSTEITVDEIMEYIHGPDFPTAGIIYDFATIKIAYQTGKGRVVIRAKANIEEGEKGSFKIVVTELPYQVNKAKLLMKIADMVRDKKIVGIRALRDDSDRKGMQITIELKRDAKPKVILNKLFKYTELQTSFAMNMVALNSEGTPQLMNIKQVLKEYIVHRQHVIVRRSQFELAEARDRSHILEGLLIALNHLDDVIDTIRKSKDSETAHHSLMTKFDLSEIQATAILEMQLKRLAALERQKIEDEYKTVQATIGQLVKLLGHADEILGIIVTETNELTSLYGDIRRTKLIKGKIGEFSEEDLVADENTVITLTESGYIKRLSPASFRSQSRGGKGAMGLTMKQEDMLKCLVSCTTHDTLLIFTNQGRVFKTKAYELPDASRQAKGTAIVNLLNLKSEERAQSIIVLNEQADGEKYITLATRQGLVKKTAVKLYENIRQNGIVAIVLNSDDELVWGRITSGKDHLMLISYAGKSIRFSETEVKNSQRDTKGVRGITLGSDDYVIGVEAFPDTKAITDNTALLIVTQNGLGKRTLLSQYPVQKRSGLGVKVADITTRTGKVAAAKLLGEEHEDVVISTKEGTTIKLPLKGKTIPLLTRPTQGVILMKLKSSDLVVAVALVEGDPEKE
ncbi:MAG TPA: DNA gyrase subunit A [Candidatus Pacebacteria bacterium]|nr:DNA gyrase subunit A [Candidatus Paceibacterota bacterium]